MLFSMMLKPGLCGVLSPRFGVACPMMVMPHRLPRISLYETMDRLLPPDDWKEIPLPPRVGLFWMLLSSMTLCLIFVKRLAPVDVMP